MRWTAYADRCTVTRASQALVIVPPQRQQPRARCAQCDQILGLVHPWLGVSLLTRDEGFHTATLPNHPGPALCADCAHTGFGVNLLATDVPASAAFWGVVISSQTSRIEDTGHGFAYRLGPSWCPPRIPRRVPAQGTEGLSARTEVRRRRHGTPWRATPLSPVPLPWADVAYCLAIGAAISENAEDRQALTRAADILTRWHRAR